MLDTNLIIQYLFRKRKWSMLNFGTLRLYKIENTTTGNTYQPTFNITFESNTFTPADNGFIFFLNQKLNSETDGTSLYVARCEKITQDLSDKKEAYLENICRWRMENGSVKCSPDKDLYTLFTFGLSPINLHAVGQSEAVPSVENKSISEITETEETKDISEILNESFKAEVKKNETFEQEFLGKQSSQYTVKPLYDTPRPAEKPSNNIQKTEYNPPPQKPQPTVPLHDEAPNENPRRRPPRRKKKSSINVFVSIFLIIIILLCLLGFFYVYQNL